MTTLSQVICHCFTCYRVLLPGYCWILQPFTTHKITDITYLDSHLKCCFGRHYCERIISVTILYISSYQHDYMCVVYKINTRCQQTGVIAVTRFDTATPQHIQYSSPSMSTQFSTYLHTCVCY